MNNAVKAGLTSLALACGCLRGQVRGLRFEAASVRPAAHEPPGFMSLRGGPGSPDPGRVIYTNVPLHMLLRTAFGVSDDEISAPAWTTAARYDLDATLPPGATEDEFRDMLRNLLVDKFHLTQHREKREIVEWDLVVAKNGSKLKPAAPGATEAVSGRRRGRGATLDRDGFPVPPPHQIGQNRNGGAAKMAGDQVTLQQLAQFLRFPIGFLDGPNPAAFMTARVVDKTGLSGEYDMKLEYEWPGQHPAGSDPSGAPDLLTALQKQLGLRLEQNKATLDMLIIDHADQTPVQN